LTIPEKHHPTFNTKAQGRVSIVTPSFNQASFLENTILSVVNQDYPDIEYLVVDGGSTDGSVEIIQRYAHPDQVSWWVSERDSGQAEAINKGLSRASGEIVAWLNSDDLYLPNAVSQAVEVFGANPQVGMIFGNAITIDTTGHPLNTLVFADWDLADLLAFRIICQPAVFMRRNILEKVAGKNVGIQRTISKAWNIAPVIKNHTDPPGCAVLQFLDPTLHYMLDHQLWLRMTRLAPVLHIDRFLAAARHHPGAKNVSQAPGFGRETLLLLEWLKQDPEFAPLVAAQQRRVEGGAYRLNARYLLDGNLPGPALRWYIKALAASPAYTMRHWHRMVYACFSQIGLKGLADRINSAWVNSPAYTQQRLSPVYDLLERYPEWRGLIPAASPPSGLSDLQ
jgi:hypothetical protein